MKKLLFILVFFITFLSCKKDNGTVKYEVTCSPGGFDITYSIGNSTEQQKEE